MNNLNVVILKNFNEIHALTPQFIFQMQKVTDQSKMDQISTFLERIDDDRDGHLKVDDVLKVIFSKMMVKKH